jgi:hypothetical protein
VSPTIRVERNRLTATNPIGQIATDRLTEDRARSEERGDEARRRRIQAARAGEVERQEGNDEAAQSVHQNGEEEQPK